MFVLISHYHLKNKTLQTHMTIPFFSDPSKFSLQLASPIQAGLVHKMVVDHILRDSQSHNLMLK